MKPFIYIVDAERRHAEAIEKLFAKSGLEVPEAADRAAPTVPDTVEQACAAALEAERRNIALYDELIPGIERTDVRQTFERLQTASRDKHLPAFTRCAQGGGHGARAKQGAQGCAECGMGATCGCARASEAEKKARAAAGGGCGCGKKAVERN